MMLDEYIALLVGRCETSLHAGASMLVCEIQTVHMNLQP